MIRPDFPIIFLDLQKKINIIGAVFIFAEHRI